MVDTEWLRNLAGASLKDGALTSEDPEGVRRLASARVGAAIVNLEEEAREAADVHNGIAKRQLRVLTLNEKGPVPGFTLLLGKAQITVTYEPYALVATLTVMKAFRRASQVLCKLTPEVDAFGSVAWRTDNALIMNNELIMKRLFEELTRAALSAG